jgi:two-component system, sensor histidine kinase LadS
MAAITVLLRSVLLPLVLIISFRESAAQKIIHFRDDETTVPIGRSVYYYEDESTALGLEDIRRGTVAEQFQRSETSWPHFGTTRAAVWLRFTIVNHTQSACVLEIAEPGLQHIQFFAPTAKGDYEGHTFGLLHPMSSRPIKNNYFLFRLAAAGDSTPHTFYLRVKTDVNLDVPMTISSYKGILDVQRARNLSFGFLCGLLVIMTSSCFVTYFIVRERTYLYYALHLFSVLLFIDILYVGAGFEYLWPETPWINEYPMLYGGISSFLILLFSSNFLQSAIYLPRLHRGLRAFYILLALSGALFFAGLPMAGNAVMQIVALLVTPYLLTMGVKAYKKQYPQAGIFIAALSFFLAAVLVFLFYINGFLPPGFYTRNSFVIGAIGQSVLLAFALAGKVNLLRQQKEQAQAETLEIMKQQYTELERLVTERTHELIMQNEEIAAQNEEISSQVEELTTQQEQIELQNQELQQSNQALRDARQTVEKQHGLLQRHADELEKQISARTEELLVSNTELLDQNKQLEEFAFIVAHNLRSPVARLLGLTNLAKLIDPRSNEVEVILQKVADSGKELDTVIHDLSKILEVRNGKGKLFEPVSLTIRLASACLSLKDEIEVSHARITQDFSAVDALYTISPYIESILYNLISNAIKYRHPDRTPVISIRTTITDGVMRLMIKDNGLGLDIQRHGAKLFQLYQRFHRDGEGRGIGLYLVKTQAEAIGAHISMQSRPQEGSEFTLVFDNVPAPPPPTPTLRAIPIATVNGVSTVPNSKPA